MSGTVSFMSLGAWTRPIITCATAWRHVYAAGVIAVLLQSDQLREMITRAQHNDPEAYEFLYQRYVDALYRYLTIRCNDTTLAEEVLGELWLRVVQALPRFRLPDSGTDQSHRRQSRG